MARASNLTMCSFCGKSHSEVKKLIAGPGVYICNECIEVCSTILEKELTEDVHSELGRIEESDEDMEMAVLLQEKNLQTFADENNVWRSRHLRLEAEGFVSEIDR